MNPLRFLCLALTAVAVAGAAASGNVATAQDATQPPPAGAVDADPVDADELARRMPACAPGTPTPSTGQTVTCRYVPPPPTPTRVRVGFNLQFGWQDSAADVDHLAVGIAAPVDVPVTDWLALGARFAYLTGGDANLDADGDGFDDVVTANLKTLYFSAGPRLRWWTSRDTPSGWQLELDGGYALVLEHMPGSGAFAEVGLRRFVTVGAPTGLEVGLSLHYRQGFGAASDARALVLGLDVALDLFAPSPAAEQLDDELGGLRYTFGPDMLIGGTVRTQEALDKPAFSYALGVHFGLPIVAALELRTRAEVGWRVGTGDGTTPKDGLTAYTGLAGLRAHLFGRGWLWTDAYVGYAFTFGTPAAYVRDGAVLDFGLGVRMLGCGAQSDTAYLEVGLRGRVGIQDNEALDAIYFALGGSYGSVRGTREHPRALAYAECAPPAPPQPAYASPDSRTTTGGTGRVDLDAGLEVHVPEVHVPEVHAQVEVEVHPVTIEVPLGLALFGGMVQMRVDVSALPLAQLREAGFVEVRIVGPEGALARAEGELRAALGPDGAHVSAWSSGAVGGVEIKAIFTIWPSGSRPPGR